MAFMYKTITAPLKKESVGELRHELRLLRSVVLSIVGEDAEGNYRPEFVKEILTAAGETPRFVFKGIKDFKQQLRQV